MGTTVYGLTLIAMILCSALYNIIGHGRWAWLLQRLDHSAIYAKIAGTYTPFTLLSGSHAPWLLAGLWGAALAGMGLKALSPERFRWLALALYMAMGWAGLLAGGSFLAALSTPVLTLIVTGAESEMCVLATVLAAVDRGYRVVLVADAVCSSSDRGHDAIMAIYRERFARQIEVAAAETVLSRWT